MYDVSNGKQSGTVAGGIGFVSPAATCIEAKNACLFLKFGVGNISSAILKLIWLYWQL